MSKRVKIAIKTELDDQDPIKKKDNKRNNVKEEKSEDRTVVGLLIQKKGNLRS